MKTLELLVLCAKPLFVFLAVYTTLRIINGIMKNAAKRIANAGSGFCADLYYFNYWKPALYWALVYSCNAFYWIAKHY